MTTPRTTTGPVAPARQVARALDATGRRLFAARFVQHAYVWAAVLVATAAIATAVRGPSPLEAVAWLAAALLAGLAAAWCSARYRRPDAAAAARTIDRELGLRGLVEAARELADEQDAVSALVVRDAARHVAGLAPDTIVPLGGPGRRAASGLALATVSWLTAVSIVGRTAPTTRPEAGGAGGTGAVTSAGPAAGDPPEQAEEVDGAPPPGATSTGSTRADGGTPGDALTGEPERAQDGTPRASDTPASETARESAAAPGASSQAGAAASRGRGASGDGTSGGRGALAEQQPQAGGPAGAAPDTGTGGPSGTPGGRGRAASTTAAATPGAGGGVTGGQALGEAPPAIAGTGLPVGGDARYRAARARAESPGGQARIPPDLRRLVHDYFIAIGPGAPE